MSVLKRLTEEYFGKTERDEDKLPPNNIIDMKPVDMGKDIPFFISDRDLIINESDTLYNESDTFYYDYVKEIENKIQKTGWQLPPLDFINSFIEYSNPFRPGTDFKGKEEFDCKCTENYGIIKSKKTGSELKFNISGDSQRYWLDNKDKKTNIINGFFIYNGLEKYNTIFHEVYMYKHQKGKIRLIKQK